MDIAPSEIGRRGQLTTEGLIQTLRLYDPVVWKDQRGVYPLKTKEDLKTLELKQINKSLLEAVAFVDHGKTDPWFYTQDKGFDPEANNFLNIIEEHFEGRIIQDISQLETRDKALLSLGLVLKLAKDARMLSSGNLVSSYEAEMAGIKFHKYGDNGASRPRLILQQNRKYTFDLNSSEAADMCLLHTTFHGQEDIYTRYEKIQSANITKARQYIQEKLEPQKIGNYSVSDVEDINDILLEGLVPSGKSGKLRQARDSYVKGRIGMTQPEDISHDLSELLKDMGNQIQNIRPWMKQDEIFDDLVEGWVTFDAIHPMEDANGRTGSLLFESWYRLTHGTQKQFVSSRQEHRDVIKAMSEALVGDSTDHFRWEEKWRLSGKRSAFTTYIKEHLVETPQGERTPDIYERAFTELAKGNVSQEILDIFRAQKDLFLYRFLTQGGYVIDLLDYRNSPDGTERPLPLKELNAWFPSDGAATEVVFDEFMRHLSSMCQEERRHEIFAQLDMPNTPIHIREFLIRFFPDVIQMRFDQDKKTVPSGISFYKSVKLFQSYSLQTKALLLEACSKKLTPEIIGIMSTYFPRPFYDYDVKGVNGEKPNMKNLQDGADELFLRTRLYKFQPGPVDSGYEFYRPDPRDQHFWYQVVSNLDHNIRGVAIEERSQYFKPLEEVLTRLEADHFPIGFAQICHAIEGLKRAENETDFALSSLSLDPRGNPWKISSPTLAGTNTV